MFLCSNCDDFATYSCMASHKKCASCVLSGCMFQLVQDLNKKEKTEKMKCVDRWSNSTQFIGSDLPADYGAGF